MRALDGILIKVRCSRLANGLGLAIFMSTVSLLPLLHNFHHHDEDHEHGFESGSLPLTSHQEAEHHHPHDDAPGHESPSTAGHEEGDRHDHPDRDHAPRGPDHGRGAIEHCGAAYAFAQIFVLTIGSVLLPRSLLPEAPSAPEPRFWLTPLQPRAPPASFPTV